MSQTIPNAVPTSGTRRAVFIPGGVADKEAITFTEVSSGDNISCYLTRTGFAQGGEQGTITDARYCSSQAFEIPGEKQKTLQLTYVFNLDDPANDQARLALQEGRFGTIVRFFQKDESDDSFDPGDWYDAVDVLAGEQNVVDGEENALDRINQKMFIRSEWVGFKQLVGSGKTSWSIEVTGSPTGGTFKLTAGGGKTAALAHNATAQDIEDALNLLPGIDGATVAGTTTKTVTFTSPQALAATNVAFTGGTKPGVTVA